VRGGRRKARAECRQREPRVKKEQARQAVRQAEAVHRTRQVQEAEVAVVRQNQGAVNPWQNPCRTQRQAEAGVCGKVRQAAANQTKEAEPTVAKRQWAR